MSDADNTTAPVCHVSNLGRRDYEPLWREMQQFTDQRDPSSDDQLWYCEHPPVFTLGMAADPSHVLAPGDIPLIKIDRGGQVTYHGPGQLMVYPLVDVRRARIGVRALVTALENTVIDFLAAHNISANARRDAPGVYVDDRKVASIGLRIRRGSAYHGMAVNVGMDLEPFSRINPCGMQGLEVTDLQSLGIESTLDGISTALTPLLSKHLGLQMLTEAS